MTLVPASSLHETLILGQISGWLLLSINFAIFDTDIGFVGFIDLSNSVVELLPQTWHWGPL